MFKYTMALILLLTPFFSQSVALDSQPPDYITSYDCIFNQKPPSYSLGSFEDASQCGAAIASAYDALYSSYGDANIRKDSTFDRNDGGYIYISYTKCTSYDSSSDSCETWSSHFVIHAGFIDVAPIDSPSCPPEEFPDYIYSGDSNDDGEIDVCYKDNPNFQKCEQGFHKYAISSGGAPAACVPIDCPNAGVQSSEWVDGSVYGNNAGTYCNGQCAYSISSGANHTETSGSFGAIVVSTGNVCGQDPNTDKWMQEGFDDECQTTTIGSTGSSFISCPNAKPDEFTDDDLPVIDNSEDEYFLEEMQELIPVEETCTAGDSACEIRNLKEKIETEGVEQKELLVELHNKMVSADANSYNTLAETIKNLQDTNNFGLEKIATQIAESTTSGGGGSDAIDVEGAGLSDEEVAEAVGGFDDTIPEEFIDIPSYTATYSGWLEGGVCPVSKDITLTILGTTTTFDLTWAPLCDIFTLIGILLQASAWITVSFMIQRTL